MKRFLQIIGGAILLLAIMFVDYGIETDCPNTAGYVHCPRGK